MTLPNRPDSATEIRDALAERMMRYRAALKAHLGYAAQQGFQFPPSIRESDPDYTP